MSGTLSLLGLYNINSGLFGELVLPDGVNRDDVVDNLLAETAELEVIYPNAAFMQAMIGRWSAKELPIWKKLLSTTKYEYDPIENYNRYEEWQDSNKHNITTDQSGNSRTSTEFTGHTEGSGEDDTENNQTRRTSAYNETDFTPTNFDSATEIQKHTAKQDSESTTKGTTQNTNSQEETGTNNGEHVGHLHGNIGVTTTQAMINEEREVVKFNIVDYIIDSFKRRFCLLVY